MKSVESWLTEYGESHQNPTNKLIHWICIPLIIFSVFGFLFLIPWPQSDSPAWLNWASVVMLLTLAYYFVLSIPLGLGMCLIWLGFYALAQWAGGWSIPLWQSSLAIFVVAWLGQFYGHKIEGKKPSFFKDLQFLLIGPLWLLAHLYKRAGLKY